MVNVFEKNVLYKCAIWYFFLVIKKNTAEGWLVQVSLIQNYSKRCKPSKHMFLVYQNKSIQTVTYFVSVWRESSFCSLSITYVIWSASQVTQCVKNLPVNVGGTRDTSLAPELGVSPGVGNGNPLQCSCLENSMDRGAWWVAVHGVAKNWTRLGDWARAHTWMSFENTIKRGWCYWYE